MAFKYLAVVSLLVLAAHAAELEGSPEKAPTVMYDKDASSPSESPSMAPTPSFAPGHGPASDTVEITIETTLTIGGYTLDGFLALETKFFKATASYFGVKTSDIHFTGGRGSVTTSSGRKLAAVNVNAPLTTLIYGKTEDEVKNKAGAVSNKIKDSTAFQSALKKSALTSMTSFSASTPKVSSATNLFSAVPATGLFSAVAAVVAAVALFF